MPRPTARERGYGSRWDKARAGFLRSHPRCERCGLPSSVVHHRRPHRGDQRVFWDRANWQAVCQPCHDGPCQFEDRHGYGTTVDLAGNPIDPNHPFNR